MMADEKDKAQAKGYESVSRVKALLIKARTAADIDAPAARDAMDQNTALFSGDNVIEPEMDPESLLVCAEQCGTLESCIQAMAVNVHGFGYTLKPAMDLDAKDAPARIAAALYYQRLQEALAAGQQVDLVGLRPSDADVAGEMARLRADMDVQRAKLRARMDALAGGGSSLVNLRMRCAQERECIGWSVMEIGRSSNGEIARGYYVPAWTFRATEEDAPVEVDEIEYITPIHTRTVRVKRKFRRYVQRRRMGVDAIWFKDLGDPRVVSRLTGRVYQDQDEFQRELAAGRTPPNDLPATEVWYDPIAWPRVPVGKPRWTAVLPAVLGMREAEEVNLDFFSNNTIPPLMILVNGGVLSAKTPERIAEFLRSQGQGRQLMNRLLVLEALPSDKDAGDARAQAPQIKLEPLRHLQLQDATHQQYDARNEEKIGRSFRLPPLLYGGHKDFNRATADAQLYQAEKAVFAPERQNWDYTFNRMFTISAWGCPLWRVVSNSPLEVDAETRTRILALLSQQNAITPAEVRGEAGALLGRDDLSPINEWWMRIPGSLAGAGVTPDEVTNAADAFQDDRAAERAGRVPVDVEVLRALLDPDQFEAVMATAQFRR